MESLDNLFTMAEQAETVKNYQEAYQYYNRILEINPKNPKALIGKGLAIGWLSSFSVPRYREAVDVITLGLKNCNDSDFQSYRDRITDGLNDLAVAQYDKLKKRYTRKSYTDLDYQKPFFALLPDILLLWITVLAINPKEQYAYQVVSVYKELTNSLSAMLAMQSMPAVGGQLQQTLDNAEKYLKEHHPGYVTVSEEEKMAKEQRDREEAAQREKEAAASKSGCFIATAVYGDYCAPEVMVLRGFRDSTLQNSLLGRLFIKCYYAVSPPIAEWLKGHRNIGNLIRKLLNVFVAKLRD